MDIHKLKILPEYFEAVVKKQKMFEIRKADRDFKIGDQVILQEYSPELKKYTGLDARREITYITEGGKYGLIKGYVILGLKELDLMDWVNRKSESLLDVTTKDSKEPEHIKGEPDE